MGLYQQDTVQEKELASDSRLKEMVRRLCGAEGKGQKLQFRNEDRSLQGTQQLGKATREES